MPAYVDGSSYAGLPWTPCRRTVVVGRATSPAGRNGDELSPPATDAADFIGQAIGVRAARELTGIAFWEWDPRSGVLTWSPEMYRLARLSPADGELTLAQWHGLVHPEDLDRARRLDLGAWEYPAGHMETFRLVGADGVLRHVRAWSIPVASDDGLTVQGAAVEVTGDTNDHARLGLLSSTDSLTGLGNRLALERRITQMLADSRGEVFLLLLDLDRFKVVNESLGHQAGDRLLVEVAQRLSDVVPRDSLTARMGGDEFVVVPHRDADWPQVSQLAHRLVAALRQPYVLPDSGEIVVCPVSVGVTSRSGREVRAEDLLSEADLALYQAKDCGRDRYVVFDDALRSRARERRLAESLLRSALQQNWLTLRYQPISDLGTGKVVGAEALVRINEPGGCEPILPDCFIEVAEDTGLVVELDCWVIDTALAELARWADVFGGGELPWLAINVSARSMEHPRIVNRLIDGLRRHDLSPESIKVELTEHSFLGALPGGESNLRRLISSGIPVGIDDFGTGYSALAYLQRFTLDFMKIDRSFVVSVGEEARADAVITAMVGLAHAHGMQVTAEGVENPRQARRLAEIGCDFVQGYHVGYPVEACQLPR
jgi:diguanylate cyclase (GGDEF)-like protein